MWMVKIWHVLALILGIVRSKVSEESTARIEADDALQEQIDTIEAKADVVDIVATKAALDAYDTSELFDNDVVKVLKDESKLDAVTYYRWNKPETGDGSWSFVGELGPFYNMTEVDALLANKAEAEDLEALQNDVDTHTTATNNPHSVTKSDVGLGNVDNVKQFPLNTSGSAGKVIIGGNDNNAKFAATATYIKRNTAYAVGARVYSEKLGAGEFLVCTQAGTTGSTEPSWG